MRRNKCYGDVFLKERDKLNYFFTKNKSPESFKKDLLIPMMTFLGTSKDINIYFYEISYYDNYVVIRVVAGISGSFDRVVEQCPEGFRSVMKRSWRVTTDTVDEGMVLELGFELGLEV